MSIEKPEELIGLIKIGRLVGLTLELMAKHVRPGVTTGELDAIAEDYMTQHGARSAPQITLDYPGFTCISVNDEAAHGIPGTRIIEAGDLVKLDVSAELDGYWADAAITVGVPPISEAKQRLIDTAKQAMDKAIAAAVAGHAMNEIGKAVEGVVRGTGYRIIRELPGHGVGGALHEAPTVFNHYIRQARYPLANGLVITIEPHITVGNGRIYEAADGWTIRTQDHKLVANFEHTLVITNGEPMVLTAV